jgi:hypothetical protein
VPRWIVLLSVILGPSLSSKSKQSRQVRLHSHFLTCLTNRITQVPAAWACAEGISISAFHFYSNLKLNVNQTTSHSFLNFASKPKRFSQRVKARKILSSTSSRITKVSAISSHWETKQPDSKVYRNCPWLCLSAKLELTGG